MKRLKPLWISLTSVFGVFAIAAVTGYFVTDNFSAAINMHFNTKTYQLVDNPDAKPEYPFRSEYDFIEYDENGRPIENAGEDLFDEDKDIISLVEEEGAVLLWNHEKALPLRNETTVYCAKMAARNVLFTLINTHYAMTHYDTNLDEVKVEVGTGTVKTDEFPLELYVGLIDGALIGGAVIWIGLAFLLPVIRKNKAKA